jgi:hypothetical protein
MKGFAVVVALILGVTVGLAGVATASKQASHAVAAKTKKKCKGGRTYRKGKCRRRGTFPPLPGTTPASPNSIVRASLSWDGPANVWMQVSGQQGRAGYFPGEGVLNEIPNAHYSGGTGGPAPETDTFTDDLFYGGYGFIYYPSPGNRGFSFTFCENGVAGPDPVHVQYMFVEANGLVDRFSWTLTPGSLVHSCLGY